MTANVKAVLEKIKSLPIFEDDIYFTGGTALAYYISHRVSEDVDVVSSKMLEYKKIIPALSALGAKKIEDENVVALRLAGLFPDEYILKFVLDNVKIEFFHANRPIQKEILKEPSFTNFENASLKILDIKSIAKLKLVAFFQRDKIRDLFDFGSIIECKAVGLADILHIATECKNINSKEKLIQFVTAKKESKDDEAVYLSEQNRLNLSFKEIQEEVLYRLENIHLN